ncbi:MAG: Rpn family recombination-promoting nuclease/putative transposase [Magnetococcales bacterium]|nr:Rpn family recombination-promoting nuclease/putative transposase [Magnetococcales bacterium]
MSEITQPHDRFIKLLLSDPEKARTLVRERLPKEVAELLSSDLPELVEVSFVDEELRGHLTDRLFRVRTIRGRVAMLYVLIDHKSYADEFVSFQLLKYKVEVWKQWVRENPEWKLLPCIVPFIFYHGETEWRIPNEFIAIVDVEEGWRPFLLNFHFPVFDLGKVPNRQLSQHPRLRAWLVAAKYATRTGKQLRMKKDLIRVLTKAGEDFYVIMRYIVETYKSYDEPIVREIIRAVHPEEENTMMSQFAQDIIAKGNPEWAHMVRQDGIQIGEQKGEATMLTRQLQRRFGVVPAWASEKIAQADISSLEEWGLRFVDAHSLDEVFSDKR